VKAGEAAAVMAMSSAIDPGFVMVLCMQIRALLTVVSSFLALAAGQMAAQTRDLPTSKQLIGPIPGHPQRLNSLPMSMAVSPDGRYVVTVNAGYGTFESHYDQSLAVLDTRSGAVRDFPDARTLARVARQTLYSGLAFSSDGSRLYASMGSITDPMGDGKEDMGSGKEDMGSGIVVYRFSDGAIEPERLLHLPMQALAAGRKSKSPQGAESLQGIPFPADIALVSRGGAERLLVADNLSDDVLLLDPASGAIEHRFDLSESDAVPATYPVALQLAKDGRRAFVALWNASEIVELDLRRTWSAASWRC
jgi:DNA-binding beta-propeller fold protein YncE